ncbi:hypothetical protein [Sphingosinicella rhizophila]|uniref:Cytochrome-c oxidase n=1 Tax=Sphingosinicella rhizophila TaxID=3050082 RepID=A0ABU3QAY5_9SPHN|nr:hypothetical protein [Sphingosinicella sp. GR2756]MDT9600573.1 hypothetical protein [Sphingosinicella sp. GR2756]
MNRYDLQFLLLATLSLIVGVVLGIVMAATQDFQLRPVHAHINLVGWASLALFGLAYRVYPVLATRRLARLHLLLSGSAAVLMPGGITLAVLVRSEALAMIASVLWLAGAIVFLFQLLSLMSAPAQSPSPAE